jgi:hypothetical protein
MMVRVPRRDPFYDAWLWKGEKRPPRRGSPRFFLIGFGLFCIGMAVGISTHGNMYFCGATIVAGAILILYLWLSGWLFPPNQTDLSVGPHRHYEGMHPEKDEREYPRHPERHHGR